MMELKDRVLKALTFRMVADTSCYTPGGNYPAITVSCATPEEMQELIKDQQARIEELEKQVVLAKGTFEHIAFMDMQGMRFPNISEAFLYVRGQATEVLKHFKIESIEGK